MSTQVPQQARPARRNALRIGLRSLSFRVVTFSTVWAVVALVVIATLISALYRVSAERSFRSLLVAHLYSLVAAVSVSDEGELQGTPALYDVKFSQPGSGWYWAVEPVSPGLDGGIRSASMTNPIPAPAIAEVPFDSQFQRVYETVGLSGERIDVVENDFILDADNRIARFRVMGNRSELELDIADFSRQLYTYLALFGVGMIAINAIVILLGLRPLDQVRNALAQVREGTAKKLDGRFPSEIEPLASETNALIENNRRIVERSRTQVGNLAHSLKTPVAVLLNEGRAMGGEKGRLIVEQAAALQQQVEHYLQRARIAAQRDSVVFRTPMKEPLERLMRVFRKLDRKVDIVFEAPERELVFAGEREDLEEIAGNLLENAVKWARRTVRVRLSAEVGAVLLTIEDDGPGIPEEQAREALKRGTRLDETKPGTGLGLAIVHDLVREYGGELALERSELGGLKAVIRLPSVG
ncbi:ATP-binding protein [Aquibium sp. LZ166]|uniref:histidine kinase n=1 Tax=Aquibium pacificus TaxID=3153579 RepID=A0ABV3SNW9_9HYPH